MQLAQSSPNQSEALIPIQRQESSRYIKWFSDIHIEDIAQVGGKNASLGEMVSELVPRGVNVPDGFAGTAGPDTIDGSAADSDGSQAPAEMPKPTRSR